MQPAAVLATLSEKPPTAPSARWAHLPVSMQPSANAQTHRGARGYRFYRYENDRGRPVDIVDPVWVSMTPGSYQKIRLYPEHPDYEAHRLTQALQTRTTWEWIFEPGCMAGCTVHLVGNGPSAPRVLDYARPGDVTVCINGAASLLKPDFWFLADSGFVGGEPWVEAMASIDVAGVNCIFSAESPARLVLQAAARAASCNTFLFATAGPFQFYQHLVPVGRNLPFFTIGRQTIVPALHFAWWIGAKQVYLYGIDQGCAVRPTSIEDYHAGLSTPNAALLNKEWCQVGGVWTHADMQASAKAVDGMCLWLQDFGIRVNNRSAGLSFDFAPRE